MRHDVEPKLIGCVLIGHAVLVELCEHGRELAYVWKLLLHIDKLTQIKVRVRIRLEGAPSDGPRDAVWCILVDNPSPLKFAPEHTQAVISRACFEKVAL